MELIYDIFTQKGEHYETVRVSGQDEEDCQEQVDLYLSTKQDCYAQKVEDELRMNEENVFPGTLTTLGYDVLGTLYTFGYAVPGSVDALEELMTASEVLLIDIRERAQSRWWPVWNKKQLRARWGSRYSHEKKLGNINRRDRSLPVVLHGPHPEQAIAGLAALLVQGYSVVLLCACRDYETCHRKVVAEMIQQEMLGNGQEVWE